MPENSLPKKEAGETHPVVHTYDADLALAMDTTDAKVVQELLQNARDREFAEKEAIQTKRQRGWYKAGGSILILLACGAFAYGIYHYNRLTVDVQESVSIGVFQNTAPIITETTSLDQAVETITTLEGLTVGKPFLVPVVSDATTLTPLSKATFMTYIDARASEPFLSAISLIRLGVSNSGDAISPFIIFSVPDPEIASKEFLIAEPQLLEMFGKILHIELQSEQDVIGTSFTSSYMYNLPVRTLKSTDPDTRIETILFYYGYATDNSIVLSTNPSILKAVYDTIIKQH